MDFKKIINECIIIFWLFVIGSLVGFMCEMIFSLAVTHRIEFRQGLVYGPFTPVYGIGIFMYYIILRNINTTSKIKIFFITMFLGGVTEYCCSLLQEEIFGTVSWDYSDMILNVNGRTSLLYCIFWGIFGVLYFQYIMPVIEIFREFINDKWIKIITIIFCVFITFDVSISFLAANRQTARRNNISPSTKIDYFLDEHYPDEFMDKVYKNKMIRDQEEDNN